jgi:proline utilization trans-activator
MEATYGYLDGEYAFSATLLLIMVNSVLPANDDNIMAMETGLSVLKGMADKGNNDLLLRHSLLLDLREAIGSRSVATTGSSGTAAAGSSRIIISQERDGLPHANLLGEHSQLEELAPLGYPHFPDVSFNLNAEDDYLLWEDVLNNIEVDLGANWIENALRRER